MDESVELLGRVDFACDIPHRFHQGDRGLTGYPTLSGDVAERRVHSRHNRCFFGARPRLCIRTRRPDSHRVTSSPGPDDAAITIIDSDSAAELTTMRATGFVEHCKRLVSLDGVATDGATVGGAHFELSASVLELPMLCEHAPGGRDQLKRGQWTTSSSTPPPDSEGLATAAVLGAGCGPRFRLSSDRGVELLDLVGCELDECRTHVLFQVRDGRRARDRQQDG